MELIRKNSVFWQMKNRKINLDLFSILIQIKKTVLCNIADKNKLFSHLFRVMFIFRQIKYFYYILLYFELVKLVSNIFYYCSHCLLQNKLSCFTIKTGKFIGKLNRIQKRYYDYYTHGDLPH